MKITTTGIFKRLRARFYIDRKQKNCETFSNTKSPTLVKKQENFNYVFTLRMNVLTMFSGALIPLHHYKRDIAHLLELKNLVIEFYNTKR